MNVCLLRVPGVVGSVGRNGWQTPCCGCIPATSTDPTADTTMTISRRRQCANFCRFSCLVAIHTEINTRFLELCLHPRNGAPCSISRFQHVFAQVSYQFIKERIAYTYRSLQTMYQGIHTIGHDYKVLNYCVAEDTSVSGCCSSVHTCSAYMCMSMFVCERTCVCLRAYTFCVRIYFLL